VEIAAGQLVREFLDKWHLRPDGAAMSGAVATVLPARLEDGVRAVLKVQPVDDETSGEADALPAWDGRGGRRPAPGRR
jgi:streptomycin 6-kinase